MHSPHGRFADPDSLPGKGMLLILLYAARWWPGIAAQRHAHVQEYTCTEGKPFNPGMGRIAGGNNIALSAFQVSMALSRDRQQVRRGLKVASSWNCSVRPVTLATSGCVLERRHRHGWQTNTSVKS